MPLITNFYIKYKNAVHPRYPDKEQSNWLLLSIKEGLIEIGAQESQIAPIKCSNPRFHASILLQGTNFDRRILNVENSYFKFYKDLQTIRP